MSHLGGPEPQGNLTCPAMPSWAPLLAPSKSEQGVHAPENNVKAPSQPQILGGSQCLGLLF